ncbi:MAG: peptidase S24 [Deltaproteobacteria bacterium]|nr:MAG: peptidase S24 [Deltaproteobacteria bacterium]
MIKLCRVCGDSMLPELSGGDYVIATRFFFSLQPHDIIVADHPVYGLLIKRILKVETNGYRLVGDNPSSLSTETMGIIPRHRIIGKVILCIRRKKQ